MLEGADEVPVGVGAVAGAHQRHWGFAVAEQRVVAFGFGQVRDAFLQRLFRWHQVFEQRVQGQEQTQVAFMRLGFFGLGDKALWLATERGLLGNRLGQLLGGDFRAVRRPVGVGAQEHLLAAQFGLLQRAKQVRGRDLVGGDTGVEVLIQVGVDAGRLHFTQVLWIQAYLSRHDRHHQLNALGLELLAHAFDQRVVAFQVLVFVDGGVELLVAVQPVIAAQYHARTAFVEQLVVQRGPQVGAQAFDWELVVVVGFDGFGPATVEHSGVGVGAKAEEAAQRPGAQCQQQHQEQADIEDA